MRTGALLLFALGCSFATAAAGADSSALDAMLRDRAAGAPVDCIPMHSNGPSSLTIVDGVALVYRDGDTIYVNRTANPRILDWSDVLVIERFGDSRLCRHDRIYTHDRSSLGRTGVVFLERFVPYVKAD